MNEEKTKFFNEFKDWTKEEILSRAYEICVKSIEITKERDKFENTLEEIRELVESYNLGKYDYSIPPNGIYDLLQIIDKTKKED